MDILFEKEILVHNVGHVFEVKIWKGFIQMGSINII
jgi:hypothetical protein